MFKDLKAIIVGVDKDSGDEERVAMVRKEKLDTIL